MHARVAGLHRFSVAARAFFESFSFFSRLDAEVLLSGAIDHFCVLRIGMKWDNLGTLSGHHPFKLGKKLCAKCRKNYFFCKLNPFERIFSLGFVIFSCCSEWDRYRLLPTDGSGTFSGVRVKCRAALRIDQLLGRCTRCNSGKIDTISLRE